ncbi:MAG: branched-chain amino acid transaminase [Spirochaetia bacterium]|nr:branched-chain amino acid transaminase [Spirochaetia bacterium]
MATGLTDKICFFNNEYIPLQNATVNIQTHALQYGTSCFGGIRGYWNEDKKNIYIFRIDEHYKRLKQSARMLFMNFEYSENEFTEIARNVLKKGQWSQNVYLRPFIYKSDLDLSPRLHNVKDSFAMYVLGLDDYLDTKKGLNVCVSSWRRIHESMIPTRSKANGGYINSALAKSEAMQNGFDEAIFLDIHGNVSEATAANIFIVKDQTLITPDLSSSILEGITRKSILNLAKENSIPCESRVISRSELYSADEVFLTGTGVQMAWIKNIDHRMIGNGEMGPVTEKLQSLFFKIVKGQLPSHSHWLTGVY